MKSNFSRSKKDMDKDELEAFTVSCRGKSHLGPFVFENNEYLCQSCNTSFPLDRMPLNRPEKVTGEFK